MLIASTGVEATVIDLYHSFPDNQGDNGFSVYGYNGGLQLLSDAGSYAFNRPGDQWANPNVYKEISSWLGAPWIFMSPAGTISNLAADDPVLAYEAPITTTYQLDGSFYLWPGSLNGVYVAIFANQISTPIWSSYLTSGGGVDFSNVIVSLNAGDKLYYLTDAINNTYFSEYNDWPMLRGTITYAAPDITTIPEPTTISLLGLGLMGLLLSRRSPQTGLLGVSW
jgi:PEP-CTERM motif